MFLSSHDKVVSLILIINNIFQVDTSGCSKFFEKLLIKYKGNAANFLKQITYNLLVKQSFCMKYYY